jgi:hypothetical protein
MAILMLTIGAFVVPFALGFLACLVFVSLRLGWGWTSGKDRSNEDSRFV